MLPSTAASIHEDAIHDTAFLPWESSAMSTRHGSYSGRDRAGAALAAGWRSGNPTKGAACRVEPTDYKGWHAEQISNRWVQLIVVPQNGGRLIQVTFAGHPYLFVNPKFAGKYLPPTPGEWFNYGGDKLWLLPEGNDDEQHWAGTLTCWMMDPFPFEKLSEGEQCEIELTGPADPQTGIQFVRTIRLDSDSPRIRFHADMKNITGHTLEWSMQSVSQYDTAGAVSQLGAWIKRCALQPRLLDIHADKSVEQLSQSVSRSLRSGGESCGFSEGRRALYRALRAHGCRIVA